MTRVLLKYAGRATALGVLAGTAVSWLIFGEAHGLGALLGGGVAGLDFIGLVLLVSRLLDPTVPGKSKAKLVLIIGAKLAVVGGLLYLVVTRMPVEPLGVVLGVGGAIGGFTLGVTQAAASPEGQSAIEAQEKRIREEMGDDHGDLD